MSLTRGFETYNSFKKNLRGIKQLYDLTFHLYIVEKERLKKELPKKKTKKVISITTSVGEITHNLISLYQRLGHFYPNHLRKLLLISAITSLEIYLTDSVYEVFKRDIAPFKENNIINLKKNYLMNLGSINELHENLIKKDLRNLTSGGFTVIQKYYNKIFEIDFKNLGIPIRELEEIHIRRHLCVHRDGIADAQYCNSFPEFNFHEGKRIIIEHDYFIQALDKISEFSRLVNNALLEKFPLVSRNTSHVQGNAALNVDNQNFMVELILNSNNFDYDNYFKQLEIKEIKFIDLLVQLTKIEKSIILFLSGETKHLRRFFKPLKDNPEFEVNKIIELKNNVC